MIDLEDAPAVLDFSGPDAIRFLNGQVTQDTRLVAGTKKVLPTCVTDAKGKLQFRVYLAGDDSDDSILVLCREAEKEDLELRLTRYLIADDVTVTDRSGEFSMSDFDFSNPEWDEHQRIEQGIPKWGSELKEGMLPPEAGLDVTDISYAKGCYIGQEVISRIKSAGKVNRRLVKLAFPEQGETGELIGADGKVCGEVTSVSGGIGLGFLKRMADPEAEMFVNGKPVKLRDHHD